jgi:hypothetical protein
MERTLLLIRRLTAQDHFWQAITLGGEGRGH